MSILSDHLDKKVSLRTLVQELNEVLASDELDWESKYLLIFSTKRDKVDPALADAGFRLSYYDPDTIYEEDARAYVSALEDLVTART